MDVFFCSSFIYRVMADSFTTICLTNSIILQASTSQLAQSVEDDANNIRVRDS